VALAIDASSPAVATTTTSTITSASFTPPTGSLLDIEWTGDTVLATNPSAPTITDNLGAHLTYALQGWQSRADSPTVDGQCAIWTAVIASSAAMTVTVTNNAGANLGGTLKIRAWTDGANTPGVGAKGKAGSTSASSIAQSYTAVSTGGQGCIVVCDDDEKGAETAGTGCTMDASGIVSAHNAYGYCRRTTADDTGGSSNTLNVTLPATSLNLGWVYVEIIPAATSIPFNPQRGASPRDYGEVQWIQRDRRDANTVGSAANPLPSPLDAAWQAGGHYWHLYSDVTSAAGRPQQRAYVSDPNLLASVVAAPPPAPARVVSLRDPGEIQWQQKPARDPALLASALLENELLGGGDTSRRYAEPFTHAPRQSTPQQPRRDGYTPGLLDSAELENELLGGADASRRYLTPASNGPRWWMPEQPRRDATTPGLLDTAELEPPQLAGDVQRHRLAGAYVDRREMPQQRGYLSDPSFYPTTATIDPLTVAWGAGGTYWLLYNTPALQVDRRESPQQRRYVSDPSLLLTALLENELLGSADATRRYRTWFAAVHSQKPEVHPSDPSLLASGTDPLALAGGVGGDIWRRFSTPATHDDRRETAAQPPRWSLYFDAGPGIPPLTLAYGAGGQLWHRYNPRRQERGWWPGTPGFALMATCSTPRPFSGVTVYATAMTSRPGSGTTARPGSGTTHRPNTGITKDPC
jgi:hypothetical protein